MASGVDKDLEDGQGIGDEFQPQGQPKLEDEPTGLRRSTRPKMPPLWHKSYEMTMSSRPRQSEKSKEKDDDDISVSTRKSTSSVVKRQEIDYDTITQLQKLEEEKAAIEESCPLLEIEIKYLKTEVDKLTKKLTSEVLPDTQYAKELETQIQELTNRITEKTLDLERKKVTTGSAVRSIERKMDILRSKQALLKAQLDEEEEEFRAVDKVDLPSSESSDEKEATKKWVRTTASGGTCFLEEEVDKQQIREAIALEKLQKSMKAEQDKLKKEMAELRQMELEQKAEAEKYAATRKSISEKKKAIQEKMESLNLQPEPESTPEDPVNQNKQETPSGAPSGIDQIAQGIVQALSKISGGGAPQTEQRQFMARHSNLKELPLFHGKPEEWLEFDGAFKRTTISCGYTDEENLGRLRKALKGDAAKAVQSLMSTPKNVPDIIKKLEIRFGDPDRIIKALIETAKSVSVIKEEKFETVLDFGDAVENLTTTIKSLNRDDHMSNPQLLEELELKMPASYRVQWREWVLMDPVRKENLIEFSKWIKIKADIVARMVKYTVKEKDDVSKKDKKSDGSSGNKSRGGKTVLTTTDESGDQKVKSKSEEECIRCKRRNHTLQTCRTFSKESEESRWNFVRENKLCFRCLKAGHWTSKCYSKAVCGKEGCDRPHHSTLHKSNNPRNQSRRSSSSSDRDDSLDRTKSSKEKKIEKPSKEKRENRNPKDTKDDSKSESEDKKDVKFTGHTYNSKQYDKKTLLRIVPVVLEGPKGKLCTFALLDGCSEISILDTTVADKLGLVGTKNPLCIQWTQEHTKTEEDSRVVNLKIAGDFPFARIFKLYGVRTLKRLSLPSQSVDIEKLATQWPHLRNSKVKNLGTARPTILIGQDNWQLLETREIRSGPPHAPGLSRTHLGWVVHGGAADDKPTGPKFMFHICRDEEDRILHQLVQDSFKLEKFGGKAVEDRPRSREDRRAIELLERTSKHFGDRWTTGLLWKHPDTLLPESRSQALFRLHCMEKKMDRIPAFKNAYLAKMEEYLTKGFVRKLKEEEVFKEGPRTWYLPHFMVYNPNKPGKPRLVFDAAAKSRGVSLNDVLSKGPDYLSSLPGCLFKFRQRKHAFTADISDMFHMIKIKEDDVQSQRFLWRGSDRSQEPDTFVIERMFFGAASSPCTSQFIKNKNAEQFRDEFPEAYNAIVHRHYMDDYSDSADTVEEGAKLCRDVIEVHQRGGFKICKFASNSRDLLEKIPEDLRSSEVKELTSEKDLPTGRTLGLWWDPEKDVITWKINFSKIRAELLEGTIPTKREVLKLVMSLFDPLGFLSHFVIRARIIYQDIWRTEIGWDDEVPSQINDKWQEWIKELKSITDMEIPRCYSPKFSTATNRQLHVFCDASTEAYSVVCYFRIESETGVETAFVAAKAKVAPLNAVAIPRLELEAALLGSRLGKTIHEEHEIPVETTHFWTDSMTVIKWIRADSRRFKPFVAHRVSEIEELTDIESWRWIPTKDNVADDATRSTAPTDLSNNSRWLTGPPFLKLPEDKWPGETVDVTEMELDDVEVRPKYVNVVSEMEFSILPDVERFKFNKLIRVTATTKKACYNFLHHSARKIQPLSPDELMESEKIWWKKVQRDSFQPELQRLSSGEKVLKCSKLKLLSPFIDPEGIIRIDGRTQASPDLKEWSKYPVILDPKHPFTRRLVQHYHEKVANHHGREMVLNEIRQKYWILNSRASVKRAWSNCQYCKNRRAQTQVPEMGQLPEARVTGKHHPFTSTGMDYFGPIEVAIGRRREKRYGVLFTCMATRAIHLEIAASLTTDSAIMAIRRFAARRGNPKNMFSDNGTNLRGADKELREALKEFDQEDIGSKMTTMGISWHFNPPSAPHTGGSWERMVRSVKTALKETIKERVPREEVLQTLFAEAEAIVNSRPLTYVSDDPEETEAITPNHFLIGRSNGNQGPGVFTDTDLCLRKQWRITQRLTDIFWRQWTRSYLPTLIRRPKWDDPMKPVKKGDIVRIVTDNIPRNQWPLGRITDVFPGDDHKVRVVDVKTQDGLYRRPVAKIIVLDLEVVKNTSPSGGKKCLDQVQE